MPSERAVTFFLENHNCAQSVLLAMSEHWKCKSDLIPKIATAFGGGIGRCGSVCGVVTGGVMALGIRFGTNEPSPEKRAKVYELAREFYRQFEKRNGTVLCRELIKHDLSNPEELAKARDTKVFEEKCAIFMKEAVNTLVKLSKSPL